VRVLADLSLKSVSNWVVGGKQQAGHASHRREPRPRFSCA